MGINVKPYLMIEWRDTESDAVGWLCVYNFVRHYSGGGTRMHPTVTADEVVRLATTMGYKYKACESETTGGCKGGIRYDYRAADAKDVLRRWLVAMAPYLNSGVSIGGDLGVDYGDVLEILDEIGVGLPVTAAMRADPTIRANIIAHEAVCAKTYEGFLMYDAVTGYGCAAALDEAWRRKHDAPGTVMLQGFGCVGASMAFSLDQMGYRVVGIADANGLVSCPTGLDVPRLVRGRRPKGELNPRDFEAGWRVRGNDEWLDVDCDILVPAALEDVLHGDNAHRVKASLVVEAANIPTTPEADRVLQARGVDVCVDFVSNLGGIRIYEVCLFQGLTDPEAIISDTCGLVRRQTRRVFDLAEAEGISTREAAERLFVPDTFDTPDFVGAPDAIRAA